MKDYYKSKCPRCEGDTFNRFNKYLGVVECQSCGFITNLKIILKYEESVNRRSANTTFSIKKRHQNQSIEQIYPNVKFNIEKQSKRHRDKSSWAPRPS